MPKLPFEVTNAPAFWRSLSRRWVGAMAQSVAGRRLLHSHTGREGHDRWQRRARSDQENVSYLLSQIPGLQFLGACSAPASSTYDCGPSSLRIDANVGSHSLRTAGRSARTGANSLVTVSHACQREWCDVSEDSSHGAELYLTGCGCYRLQPDLRER